ncbi:transglutaminase-like domain-containing protein [Embleya hyalina]|uniref:Transglutaminase n=1 Tax=Embleya hyalina TaxID=516124 RepID=A0A401YMM7_9ACTN|nr:transglutaminase-like domain-containing protein [Embleya hyalina]GCD95870.1 transglutaminase [Embleya hyalina]
MNRRADRPGVASWSWSSAGAIGFSLLATIAACGVYGGFFDGDGYRPPLAAASLSGALTGWLLFVCRSRWSRWRGGLAGAGVVGSGLLTLIVVVRTMGDHDEPRSGSPILREGTAFTHDLTGGWARMLTVMLPADVDADLLTTPAVVTWLSAFCAATLALRPTTRLAAGLPPLVAFGIALLLVAPEPGTYLMPATILAGAVGLLLIGRAPGTPFVRATSQGADQSVTRARRVRAVAYLALVLASALAAGALIPAPVEHERLDPRRWYAPRVELPDAATPLARIVAERQEKPARPLFTVSLRGPGAARVQRVRSVTLEEYDGSVWRTHQTFTATTGTIPVDPALASDASVTARVFLHQFAGPFLPTVGNTTHVVMRGEDTEGRLAMGAESGSLLLPNVSSTHGEYELTARIPSPVDDQPRVGADVAAYTPPPDTPDALAETARNHVANRDTPRARLAALQEYVRSLPEDDQAPPGTTYRQLVDLTGTSPDIATGGNVAQHAALLAVLARSQGFSARVAVGYRLRPPVGGSTTVTTADATTWVEIRTERFGWVAFDAEGRTTVPPRTTREPVPPSTRVVPPSAPPSPPSAGPGASSRNGYPSSHAVTRVLIATMWLLVASAVAGIGSAALAVSALKARRKRVRRRARCPRDRILGAWLEVRDCHTDRGLVLPTGATALELVAHLREMPLRIDRPDRRAYLEAFEQMAAMISDVVYSDDPVEPRRVARAWTLERDIRYRLLPRRRSRIRVRLTPRSLRRLPRAHDGRRGRHRTDEPLTARPDPSTGVP